MTKIKTICVYCGCSDKIKPIYIEAAHEVGAAIAQRGLRLVYGAGRTGLMGAVANSALDHGGEVIGILPEIFNTPQLAHKGLTRLEVVPDMRASKARFEELSDAFIALPGESMAGAANILIYLCFFKKLGILVFSDIRIGIHF